MEQLYIFLIRNDVWIYFLCALGLIWYLWEFVRGQQALRRARFNLEREDAQKTRLIGLSFSLLFAAVVAAVVYVNVQIQPTLPPDLLRAPSPTPNPFPTLSADEAGTRTPAITPTLPLAPTATLRPDRLPIPQPDNALPGEPLNVSPVKEGCTETVNITQPTAGQTVFGGVTIFGTATDPDFAFYRLEISGPQTDANWLSLLGSNPSTPVSSGFLGNAPLSSWLSGIYQLRLVVVNNSDIEVGSCLIQIGISNQ